MTPQLSKDTIIERDLLQVIGDERLEDARKLLQANRFAASVYLGGYAVECHLKAAICKTLDIQELPKTFTVHNLELLLLYSGLENRMKSQSQVYDSFREVEGVWRNEGRDQVRYQSPSEYKKSDAENFLARVDEVVQWIKGKTS